MSKTVRTQYVSYKFLQNIILSPTEHALINMIMIRPNYCLENLDTIGKAMSRSARTVQRTIEKLIQKGIIEKHYTTFKRIVLKIKSLADQDKIAKNGIISQVFKFCAFKKRRKQLNNNAVYDATPVSGLDATPVSESIKRSNKEKSIINTGLKTIQKYGIDFNSHKNNQISAYLDFLKR